MSSRGGSSNSGGGAQSIPAASKKMVQSLKEIVNCPDHEIYATLKECNMDPNEAVNRLLSQDPFHEVKSKREKKKENKDTVEFRSRGTSSSSTRGGRGSSNRYVGRSSSSLASDAGALHGKPAYQKENGPNAYLSPSSASGTAGSKMNNRPSVLSDFSSTENKGSSMGSSDGTFSAASQTSSAHQHAWLGVPGQMSMADIVKMGRPVVKASAPNPYEGSVNDQHVHAPRSTALHYEVHEGHISKSDMTSEPGVATGQNISPNDEWPLPEQAPATIVPSESEFPADSLQHADISDLSYDRINQQSHSQADEVESTKEVLVENRNMDNVGPASVSSRKIQENNYGDASLFDDDLHTEMDSYQSHRHAFELDEVENVGGSVSSMTSNLQQLSIQEDRGASSEEDHPSVVIPDHLQVQNADCSRLSFGSFSSGMNAAIPRSFSSRPLRSNLEKGSVEADGSSTRQSDTRNVDYFGEEPPRASADGHLVHITGANAGSYSSQSASQPEVLQQDNPGAAQENQYIYSSSTPGYTFENAQQSTTGSSHTQNFENVQQSNTGSSHTQTSSQMQNIAPYSSVMQEYTNSLPSALLAANVQPLRESDLPYLPFPVAQSMPTKYGNTVSSFNHSALPMPETLKTANFASTQSNPQTLTGSTLATGPALPQHLSVHPYSQPTLPLGPFANMISYPFLPQSYTYMPSAFQQAFAGNSTYHQSLAAALPQYKNSASVSSLPQSAAVAPGYGAFGSSTNIPGNFTVNTPAAPSGTTIGYDDVLSSQYKDNSHLISLQQNENSAMWVHGPGSRTMPAVPASTYYSFQGQNQQPAAFRQSQQPSQTYGAPGYPNYYHTQAGISLEHQQQNPRDGSLGGSQSQQSTKQSQQLWQSTY